MRLPSRWNKVRRFMWPISLVYRILVWWRNLFYRIGFFVSRSVSVPVVSIGNLTVGGTGKTPAVIYLANMLLEMGYRPGIVSRGYGRATSGGLLVSDGTNIFADSASAGDEPYLVATRLKSVPLMVDEDRFRGAEELIERHAVDLILLDDGFQHRGLARDCDLVLIDASAQKSDYRMFPFGSLREPLSALRRSAALIWTRLEQSEIPSKLEERTKVMQPLQLASEMEVVSGLVDLKSGKFVQIEELDKNSVIAFCGIARPRSFYHTLYGLGIEPTHVRYFDDHHRYTDSDLEELSALAREPGTIMITTEKDSVKLAEAFVASHAIYAVRVNFALNDSDKKRLTELFIDSLPLPATAIARGEA